ncbi:hypothetical protein EON65_35555 [archaeon]|nr:MAG: hypothetical protein EON65_35555 [archaeon]
MIFNIAAFFARSPGLQPSAAFAFASDRGGCHRNINASVKHTILIKQQVRRMMEESIANLISTKTSNLSLLDKVKRPK